ncbi:MAG: substrate-binding domain-containing protein [Actinomycetota bacterium]|nr:substrate-binding domain-containing protein [Actinomycetota bacterium]
MTDAFPPKETIELAATLTEDAVSRRRFLQLLGGAAGAVAASGTLAACSEDTASGGDAESSPAASTTTPASLVRLSSVVSPQDGGLYDDLLPDFERQTGYQVELTTGHDVYGPARDGQADVVLSHYGHNDAQAFVQDGLGQWPQPVFSNQLALLGPPEDPAQIQYLTDLVEAFRRIANTQSPLIANDTEGVKYLTEILWDAAGSPEKEGWYSDQGLQGQEAITKAAQQGGYVFWGLTPFLRTQQQNKIQLQPLVLNDPLLQRIMVTVAVNSDKVAGVNVEGVRAFQQYLLAPATQARIRAFRLPGIDQQIWWPAGRTNASYALPKL